MSNPFSLLDLHNAFGAHILSFKTSNYIKLLTFVKKNLIMHVAILTYVCY